MNVRVVFLFRRPTDSEPDQLKIDILFFFNLSSNTVWDNCGKLQKVLILHKRQLESLITLNLQITANYVFIHTSVRSIIHLPPYI